MGFLDAVYGSKEQEKTTIGRMEASEEKARDTASRSLSELEDIFNQTSSVDQSVSRIEDFQKLLSQLSSAPQDLLPTSDDVFNAKEATSGLFAAEENQLNEIFKQERIQSNREAASLGRSTIDPVLQAQLRISKASQLAGLESRKTTEASRLALQLPALRQQALERQASFAEVLANQGISNRQSLMEMGSSFMSKLASIRGMEKTKTTSDTPSAFTAFASTSKLGMELMNGGGGEGDKKNSPGLMSMLSSGSGAMGGGAGAAGGAGGGMGMMAMFSDRRLKNNIKQIGTSNSGINIYEFSYKSIPNRRFTGAMAQELLESNPEAVLRHSNGYYMVDYNKIDVDCKEV